MIEISNATETASMKIQTAEIRVATTIQLSSYRNDCHDRGSGPIVYGLWYLFSKLVFERSWFIHYGLKCWLLRRFGGSIGYGVVIKPGVKVKYPWRLNIGDHVWIGEDTWIDNLDVVTIGTNVCISQGVYLCTGAHDFSRKTFDLITKPIVVEHGAWIAARATILPGVTVGVGALCAAGSVVHEDVAPRTMVGGCPARRIQALPSPA